MHSFELIILYYPAFLLVTIRPILSLAFNAAVEPRFTQAAGFMFFIWFFIFVTYVAFLYVSWAFVFVAVLPILSLAVYAAI